jgi:hypothetical protein
MQHPSHRYAIIVKPIQQKYFKKVGIIVFVAGRRKLVLKFE